jgi:hypothetical protein
LAGIVYTFLSILSALSPLKTLAHPSLPRKRIAGVRALTATALPAEVCGGGADDDDVAATAVASVGSAAAADAGSEDDATTVAAASVSISQSFAPTSTVSSLKNQPNTRRILNEQTSDRPNLTRFDRKHVLLTQLHIAASKHQFYPL